MPKVLGYTPSWLTRPSPGHGLFSSTEKTPPHAIQNGFKAPTNGEDYRRPQRTIAYRTTEVFVAVNNQIRWSDLSLLKYDWECLHGRGAEQADAGEKAAQAYKVRLTFVFLAYLLTYLYKVLEAPISEPIRQLSVSPDGQFLAIATSHTIHVAILPSPSKFDEDTKSSIKVQLHTLGPTCHVLKQSPVACILWHPCGAHGACLVTVTVEAVVRLWELNKSNRWSFDAPTLALDLRKLESAKSQEGNVSPRHIGTNRGFSAEMIDLEIASACFGGTEAPEESAWSAMTLWTVTVEGVVYALCPLLPSKWQPTPTQIPSLTAIANVKRSSPSPDTYKSGENGSRLHDDQWEWLSEIESQVPYLAAREDNITIQDAIYCRPDRPGPVPRLQGPFRLSADSSEDYLDVSDIRVIASKLDVEELMLSEDDEFKQGLQEDTEGLSSAIVCLLTTDGRVHVFLDLEGVEGSWLPAKATESLASAPSILELVQLEVLETLKPEKISEDEWPTFSRNPFSRYSFFTTHSQGVFFFSLDPWTHSLEKEIDSATIPGAQSRLNAIRQSLSTLRERIISFDQINRGQAPSASACVVFNDSDLGYFLLTSTNDNALPHAASLDLPKSVAIKGEPLSDDPDDPVTYSDDGEPFTELITRPTYEPSSVFWNDSFLPSFAAQTIPPHRRHVVKEEIRYSKATFDLIAATHRILIRETNAIQAAVADLINRCCYMMQDMAEQLKQLRLAAARAEDLQNGGGDEEVTGDNANERLENRLERAKERDERLKERMAKLKRRVTQLEVTPLNEKEKEFGRELRKLDRATNDSANGSTVNGNARETGEGEPWWLRYEEVKLLSEELLDTAKHAGVESNGLKDGGDREEYAVPSEMRKKKVEHVMGLLERQSTLVDAVTGRLERLGVGIGV